MKYKQFNPENNSFYLILLPSNHLVIVILIYNVPRL